MKKLQLSSAHSASIFVNAGLTHFEPTPRQPSTFSGISPRTLPTVPENETTTPIEESLQQPASLPPIPLTKIDTAATSKYRDDKQISFDPFISLDQQTFNEIPNERPPSPTEHVSFPLKNNTSPTSAISQSEHSNPVASQTKSDPLSNVKPVVYDNPWDLVPDQPNINVLSASVITHQGKGFLLLLMAFQAPTIGNIIY